MNSQSLKIINKPILFVLSVPRPLTRAMIPYLFRSKVNTGEGQKGAW